MEQQQAKFDGWAIVEVFGHQRYAGYVTTEVYGTASLFRVDVPELAARERTTKQPGYHPKTGDWLPVGTVVQEGAVQGYTKLLGVGSIFAITPCTEDVARADIEAQQRRPWLSVQLPPDAKALPPHPVRDDDFGGADGDDDYDEDDCEDEVDDLVSG